MPIGKGWTQQGQADFNDDIDALITKLQLGEHFNANSWNAILAGYGTFPLLAQDQPGQGDMYKDKNIGDFFSKCAINFPYN
ncbi:MAG: hypothetical protein ACJAVV_001591 [Alphaproteobacteria bacterium]|jgi:hypothetical protein